MPRGPDRNIVTLLAILALALAACAEPENENPDQEPGGLPDSLAFEYQRPDVGSALSAAEITDFTRKLTGFWKQVGYFPWVLQTSHGVHESTGQRPYMVWWDGVHAFREGNQVRFYHVDPDGGGHNIMIPTPRVLSSAIAGYLLTGDRHMAEVSKQYCRGITATMLGMVHDQDDTLDHLMARNIAAFGHSYQTEEGYQVEIDYSGWYHSYEHWNTCRFPYPDNPYWDSIWVTNMRSKDDVPHIYLAVPHIAYAAEQAEDADVKEACAETLSYLQAFAKDIVDQGYRIRSKDENGEPFLPGYTGDEEADQAAGDLASFVSWDELIPNAECNAKRTSALIGYGDDKRLDCGPASGNSYEDVATTVHYYNHAIVRFFHLAHIANALINHDNEAAQTLLTGMATRIEGYYDTPDADLPCSRSEWENDLALLALRSAAFGLPLTSREARLIHQQWIAGVDEFSKWEYWNLWDPAFEDGQLPIHPSDERDDQRWARIEDITLLLEYCWSPLRNPAGVKFIDCDIVADPAQWGQ